MKKNIIIVLIILLLSSCYLSISPSPTGTIVITLPDTDKFWWSDEIYMKDDIIWHYTWYISLQDNNVDHDPDISPLWWKEYNIQ